MTTHISLQQYKLLAIKILYITVQFVKERNKVSMYAIQSALFVNTRSSSNMLLYVLIWAQDAPI